MEINEIHLSFKRDLSGTQINHIPHDGLNNLSILKLEGTPNLWEISNEIVAIPTLQKVKVAKNQRWLCCAFQMKRSVMSAPLFTSNLNASQLCPSVQPTTAQDPKGGTKSTIVSTTQNPFNGFGRKRKRKRKRRKRSFGFGPFIINNSSFPTQRSRRFESYLFMKYNYIVLFKLLK